ncbi:MAG: cupin domain-containing protein [Spirosoma sp.]|nr:cupin domain-containing protein [Spirosoma sp.]
MKPVLLILSLLTAPGSLVAQAIPSSVYAWNQAPVVKNAGYEERTLLTGSTRDFSTFRVLGITRLANQPEAAPQQVAEETLVIVKEGELTLTTSGKTKTLGPGSIALIMPGDTHQLNNRSVRPLTYYLMQYRARQQPKPTLNQLAGGSMWVDWNDVAYQPNQKGGIRRIFDRATVMANRFEMHVTTLNAGLWSHPPHTHRAAEILLPIDNMAQESIDGKLHPASTGDVIFLESDVPHAIQNTSAVGCTYFAFQFE